MKAGNRKTAAAANNVYTALVALATLIVLATSVFVAIKCQSYYDTMFKIFQS